MFLDMLCKNEISFSNQHSHKYVTGKNMHHTCTSEHTNNTNLGEMEPSHWSCVLAVAIPPGNIYIFIHVLVCTCMWLLLCY